MSTKNKLLLIIILTVYIIVPLLIFVNRDLYRIKFYILSCVGFLIFLLMKIFKVSNKELGITNINFLRSIKINMILIVLCLILIIIFKLFHMDKYNSNETLLFYVFYVFISCPIQEFLYRGVFGYFDINYKSSYLWVIISSLCYSFVHIIYRDFFICLLTFIIGIIWYVFYKKDKNLCGVTLSHMVLGIVTIVLGIID